MSSYYIINTYNKSNFLGSSDIFYEKSDALETKKLLDTNTNVTNIIFNCKPINCKPDRTLHTYNNGYLLIPTKDDIYYNMEYYNKGIWLDDMNGWYYDKSQFNTLIECGYELKNKIKNDYSKYNINTMEIYFYDAGFILNPLQTYKYYGQKYLLGGIWNNDLKGWYFKNMKIYNKLISFGAIDSLNDTFME